MRSALSMLSLLALFSCLAQAAQWGGGAGMETRLQREVNPDYADLRNSGLVYGKITLHSWSFLLEVGNSEQQTSSGALKVSSRSLTTRIWSRYNFALPSQWTPFLSGGLGESFDQVETEFGSARDVRNGTTGSLGVGGGLTGTYGQFQIDGELRVSLYEYSKDPELSALLRVGFLIL